VALLFPIQTLNIPVGDAVAAVVDVDAVAINTTKKEGAVLLAPSFLRR